MTKIIDEAMLSAPLLTAVATTYFLLFWKPRQANQERVARTEIVFWSTVLTVLVGVLVYASLFRH